MQPNRKQDYKEYRFKDEGWYRIGTFEFNKGASSFINFATFATLKTNAGILAFIATKGYAYNILFEKILYKALENSSYITKFRLVWQTYSNQCYIEVFKTSQEAVSMKITLAGAINVKLYDKVQPGNVEEGYSTTELELNKEA